METDILSFDGLHTDRNVIILPDTPKQITKTCHWFLLAATLIELVIIVWLVVLRLEGRTLDCIPENNKTESNLPEMNALEGKYANCEFPLYMSLKIDLRKISQLPENYLIKYLHPELLPVLRCSPYIHCEQTLKQCRPTGERSLVNKTIKLIPRKKYSENRIVVQVKEHVKCECQKATIGGGPVSRSVDDEVIFLDET